MTPFPHDCIITEQFSILIIIPLMSNVNSKKYSIYTPITFVPLLAIFQFITRNNRETYEYYHKSTIPHTNNNHNLALTSQDVWYFCSQITCLITCRKGDHSHLMWCGCIGGSKDSCRWLLLPFLPQNEAKSMVVGNSPKIQLHPMHAVNHNSWPQQGLACRDQPIRATNKGVNGTIQNCHLHPSYESRQRSQTDAQSGSRSGQPMILITGTYLRLCTVQCRH